MAKRFCFINPQSGNVKVLLSVTNGLISGGDFIIVSDPDSAKPTTQLNWKMKTNDDGTDTFIIDKINPGNLIDKDMAWEILTCCSIPGSDSGNLKLELFQGNTVCVLSIPVNKDLTGLPQCSGGEAQPFKGKLRFASV